MLHDLAAQATFSVRLSQHLSQHLAMIKSTAAGLLNVVNTMLYGVMTRKGNAAVGGGGGGVLGLCI